MTSCDDNWCENQHIHAIVLYELGSMFTNIIVHISIHPEKCRGCGVCHIWFTSQIISDTRVNSFSHTTYRLGCVPLMCFDSNFFFEIKFTNKKSMHLFMTHLFNHICSLYRPTTKAMIADDVYTLAVYICSTGTCKLYEKNCWPVYMR
jgi:hypothetical protein